MVVMRYPVGGDPSPVSVHYSMREAELDVAARIASADKDHRDESYFVQELPLWSHAPAQSEAA